MSTPTSYVRVSAIIKYLKNPDVSKSRKIEYLKKRNDVIERARASELVAFLLTKRKAGEKRKTREEYLLNLEPLFIKRYPHFNHNVLNNVKVDNIFSGVTNNLSTRYEKYPTIMRILDDRTRAKRSAYGTMLSSGIPFNVIRTLRTMVSGTVSNKDVLKANKTARIQTLVNSMRKSRFKPVSSPQLRAAMAYYKKNKTPRSFGISSKSVFK